ncbi:MAG: HAD-IB family hydrolase [Gammaproteobacteria bacterium]
MNLAIFDLDNTLLGGDSDYLWGRFLVEQGIVDSESYERENRRFYEEYKVGTLDIHEFLRFSLRPLAEHDVETLHTWRDTFMQEKIAPIMLPAARDLLEKHRAQGHLLLIITATNRFVTELIAAALNVDHLIATEPEMMNGRYTGNVTGVPSFREGKVKCLENWLKSNGINLASSWFYSDSLNDLPLLEMVTHPVAVDPDDTLADHARMRGWPIISLRSVDKAASSPL